MASRGTLVQEGIPEAIVTHPTPKRELKHLLSHYFRGK